MKKFKKLISIMLTAVMALAMSVTAFAAEDTTPQTVEHKYEIYQIFTGDYAKKGNEEILSNVKWGKNGIGTVGEAVDDDTLKALQNISATTDSGKLEVITDYANLDKNNAFLKNANANETYKVDPGYYLIKDEDDSLNNTNEAYTLYVVEVTDGNLKIVPKGNVPKLEKNIVENNDRVDTNTASIGDTVNYEITGTVADRIADYKSYYYVFTDTLSKGLTSNDDFKVEIVNGDNRTDVTDKFYIDKGNYDPTKGTAITVGVQDLKDLGVDVNANTKVVLTYSAMLNENAVIGGPNPNTAKLEFFNDPNNSGKGEPGEGGKPETEHPTGVTPEEKVETYTTELAILKIKQDGANDTKDILEGAEFTLTSSNGKKVGLVASEEFVSDPAGKYYKLKNGSYTTMKPVKDEGKNDDADYDLDAGMFSLVRTFTTTAENAAASATATIDADGRITFTGLGEGDYKIEEKNVPEGYNKAADITFKVSFDRTKKEFSADNVSLGADNTLETTIVNKKGSLLPETGGIGTTIFYIVGAILVIGAGVILVAKKRMSHE